MSFPFLPFLSSFLLSVYPLALVYTNSVTLVSQMVAFGTFEAPRQVLSRVIEDLYVVAYTQASQSRPMTISHELFHSKQKRTLSRCMAPYIHVQSSLTPRPTDPPFADCDICSLPSVSPNSPGEQAFYRRVGRRPCSGRVFLAGVSDSWSSWRTAVDSRRKTGRCIALPLPSAQKTQTPNSVAQGGPDRPARSRCPGHLLAERERC